MMNNQTIKQIYEEYTHELNRALDLELVAPEKFDDPEFVHRFMLRLEKLETLIALYADLLLLMRS
jgi:hypothetical protein